MRAHLDDLHLDRVVTQQAHHLDGPRLADAVHARHGLLLHRRVHRRVCAAGSEQRTHTHNKRRGLGRE